VRRRPRVGPRRTVTFPVGVPSHPVANSDEIVADPQLAHRGHFVETRHGELGTTWVEASRAAMSRTPAVVWRAGPTFGEDVHEVLSGTLGYSDDRIADLAAGGMLE